MNTSNKTTHPSSPILTGRDIENAIRRSKKTVVFGRGSRYPNERFRKLYLHNGIIGFYNWTFIPDIENFRNTEVSRCSLFGGCLTANIGDDGHSAFFKVYSLIDPEPTLDFIIKCLGDEDRLVISTNSYNTFFCDIDAFEHVVEKVDGEIKLIHPYSSTNLVGSLKNAKLIRGKGGSLAVMFGDSYSYRFKFYTLKEA